MTDTLIASLVEEVGAEVDLGSEGVAAIASELHDECLDILHTANRGAHGGILFVEDEVLSEDRLLQVVLYTLRDMGRVSRDQGDKTSVAKYVGYIGFWFCKLKPITAVWRPAIEADTEDSEIYDINERVALVLMDRVLLRLVSTKNQNVPSIWKNCVQTECELAEGLRGICYFTKSKRYFSHMNHRFREYLIYTLRYRAGGPYMLVNYLEEAFFFSCEHANAPMFKVAEVAPVDPAPDHGTR